MKSYRTNLPFWGCLVCLVCLICQAGAYAADEAVFPGADEKTPSRCFFFDWINSQYEGTTEAQTLINLDFFQWLHDEYGMALDIYSLDVGNIDDGPYTAGVGRLIPDHYGTMDSVEFKQQFPRGFKPLCDKAVEFGCRLGNWLGPDGFGDTPEQEKARFDMLVSMCRDFNFMLFKFDGVAGALPEDKQDIFIRALVECRRHCPDLIALNERIDLGKAAPYVSTHLWEGAETYIDVFNNNECTAPHHRAGALARPLPPGLGRLIEDHGVCLSSCMDYWEDDLVLQAFNRCLLLAPFRSCLVVASTSPLDEVGVSGCDYEVVCDVADKPVTIKLLGLPGTSASVRLEPGERRFEKAILNGMQMDALIEDEKLSITFPGSELEEQWHRKIGDLAPCDVPPDAEALFEATCFAADNNALEVRSLLRSGPTSIPQVAAARDAFFQKPMFKRRGIWDRNLFDGDIDTFFHARFEGGVFRVDFGETLSLDSLVLRIKSRHDPFISKSLHAFAEDNRAEVSPDLIRWIPAGQWSGKGSYAMVRLPTDEPMRYLRIFGAPMRIAEVEGYLDGRMVDRSKWRASNLFHAYEDRPAIHAWSHSFTLKEIPEGSYLALALPGRHGNEGAYATLRIDDRLVGAPDRAVSYPCNPWEYKNVDSESNYTYYFPLNRKMEGCRIEAMVLVLRKGVNAIKPELYITAYPAPMKAMDLTLF